MKKIFALVLAALLVAGMVSAIAAPDDVSANYKVNFDVDGITEGNTLYLYKIINLKIDTATNAIEYQLASGTGMPFTSAEGFAALTPDEYSLQTWSSSDTNIRYAADRLAEGIAKNTITAIGDAVSFTAGSGNKVEVRNLDAGWYLGIVKGTADTSTIYHHLLINALPVVDAENNTYTSASVPTISMKKETDTITKTVNDSTSKTTDLYSVGQYVPYHIVTHIPNYAKPAKVATFKITDTPDRLTDVIDTTGDHEIKVYVDGAKVTSGDSTWTIERKGTDGFTINFAQNYILDNPSKEVKVDYYAQIKSDAVIKLDGETATNSASIIFNPNPNYDSTVEPEDSTKDYTYGLVVYKYDEDSGLTSALKGAEFELYKVTSSEDQPTTGKITTLVTNEAGLSSTKGLGAGLYALKETKAPAGFNLPADVWGYITINSATATSDDPTTTGVTEEFFFKTDVPNKKGTTLPSTGGIGTTIFYVGGSILVLAAAILLITKRRMSNND